MLQITLMDPYMWADLSPFIKLTEISNNKPKTKNNNNKNLKLIS
jgi:hypothetical protein